MAEIEGLRRFYTTFKLYADAIINAPLETSTPLFRWALTGSFAKVFEFNHSLRSAGRSQDPFFCTATLRGICEDIIILKFISRLSAGDREELLGNINMLSVVESMIKQSRFFQHYRPWQPVLSGSTHEMTADDLQSKLRSENVALMTKHHWTAPRYGSLPTTKFMATEVGLADLYDYLYAATSKWVHFSPRMLYRMGWGTRSDGSTMPQDGSPLTFTTQNFAAYYHEFNECYGTLLFLTFNEELDSELKHPPEAKVILGELKRCLNEYIRWPEDITFEEMNTTGPPPFVRVLLRVKAEDVTDDNSLATPPTSIE